MAVPGGDEHVGADAVPETILGVEFGGQDVELDAFPGLGADGAKRGAANAERISAQIAGNPDAGRD